MPRTPAKTERNNRIMELYEQEGISTNDIPERLVKEGYEKITVSRVSDLIRNARRRREREQAAKQ